MGEVQKQKIPFGPNQESGWDPIGGAGSYAMNVTVDGRGTVRRRPGIRSYFTDEDTVVDDTGLSGIYATTEGKVFATSSDPSTKAIYRITPTGVVLLGTIVGSSRPTFAETQTLLVFCAGQKLHKVTKASNVLADLGGTPPYSTHVVAHASRLAALDLVNRGSFNYSAISQGTDETGFELWDAAPDPRYLGIASDSGFFSAESRSDPIVALRENTNEIFAFGTSSVQTFAADAQSVYASSSTREFGCSAPGGIIKDDQNFAWTDHLRRIVHSDGRSFNIVSDPLKQELDDMETFDDCFGYRVVHGPTDALVWSFPTDGRTFAFQRGAGWSQWGGWNGTRHIPFRASCIATMPGGKQLVGMGNGKVGYFDAATPTDLGETIQCYLQTGHIDHDTASRKHCRCVRIVLRRGTSTSAEVPEAKLEYRDDLGAWRRASGISMGARGDNSIVVQCFSLGVYRERQWRLTFTGLADFVMAEAEEEFEILEA